MSVAVNGPLIVGDVETMVRVVTVDGSEGADSGLRHSSGSV